MSLFLINARDRVNAVDIRMSSRPAHLDWLKALGDKLRMAGPVLADDGKTPAGSALIVEFDTLEEAETWAAQDPYARAGLFQSVEIIPFLWVLGEGKPA